MTQKEKDKYRDITYKLNLKYDTNHHICEIKTDSQTYRTDLWLPGVWLGGGEGRVGSLGLAEANIIYKMDE